VPSTPTTEEELLKRARRLAGRPLSFLAAQLGVDVPPDQKRAKGWVGQLLEKSLGATASSRAVPDFELLGVEMKTLPVDAKGAPTESTFVATLDMADHAAFRWETSSVRKKLDRVLWIPVEAERTLALADRKVGTAILWSPSAEEEAALRADFEEIADLIAEGFGEQVTGERGKWLQLRPKGADSKALRWAYDPEGAPMRTAPRAFYLRPAFTAEIIRRHYQRSELASDAARHGRDPDTHEVQPSRS
jgi:DNA mismatch repair protein MutH